MANNVRSKPLSRRTFLMGAGGVAVSLPFLEIMMPRRASADVTKAPKRLVVWSTPNGTVTDNWRPIAGTGPTDFQLSEILSPLAAHKNDMVVVQNLEVPGAYGHHWVCSLTGRPAIDSGYPNLVSTGISMDQVLAQKLAGQTALPSLQLGVQVTGGRETTGCVSWAGAGVPLPPENNPYLVYGKLFGLGGSKGAEDMKRLLARKRSVLDSVVQQEKALAAKLGTADRAVLGSYLQSVRDLEMRLVALEASQQACAAPTVPRDPTVAGAQPVWLQEDNVPQVIDVMRRLIVAAFSCDVTRIVTLNLCNNGGAFRMHRWIPGIDHGSDWHGHSHGVELGNRASLTAIEKYYYAELAKLAADFKSVTMPDGTSLLANSLIMTNNEYGPNGAVDTFPADDGGVGQNFTHQAKLMPYVLLGQAGGALKTGRNLVYDLEAPRYGIGLHQTKLLISVLNMMGVPDTTFGAPENMQGPLPGLAS